MKKNGFLFSGMLLLACLMFSLSVDAQQVSTPRPSTAATLTQTLGMTQVTINYSRPMVNEREIWGKLVPYSDGKSNVWRAGANENTVINFDKEVMIEGKKLAAGSYSIHMLPGEEKCTLIFNNNTQAWGSFFYDEKLDALRVEVKPQDCGHHEMLTYDFISYNPKKGSGTCALSWAKKQIPFNIETNMQEDVLANMRGELTGVKAFTWQSWNSAARYCLNNNVNLEEALTWADRSIKGGFGSQANFTTLQTKAGILAKMGNEKESEEITAKAMTIATNAELNNYGYQLLGQAKKDQAVEIFKMNAEKHTDDPNTWDSLGEAYASRNAKGDKEKAIKAFKKSLSMDPPDNVRANSQKHLEALGVKMVDGK